MKDQVLSIEQMKHLQELGVDTSKAKMAWYATYEAEPTWYNELRIRDEVFDKNYPSVPTFTLQDMLEMMPKKIMIEMSNDFCRSVEAYFLDVSLNICNDKRQCGYIHFSKRENYICHKYENTDLLTCVYEMLCWLAENNYIGGEK